MDAFQMLIDVTEGSLDIAEPLSAAQILVLARVLADRSLAGRKREFGEVAVAYQPDHLITRLEDATARLNELAPGDDGDTPRLEAAIERVADLLDEVRDQRDRGSHIRSWALHGLRRIEDLTTASNTHVLYISSDAVRQIIAETRVMAYQGAEPPPDADAEAQQRKLAEAETLLAEMQGALSKVQRERDEVLRTVASAKALHDRTLSELECITAECNTYSLALRKIYNIVNTTSDMDEGARELILALINQTKAHEPAS